MIRLAGGVMMQRDIRTDVWADNFVSPPRNKYIVSCVVLGLHCTDFVRVMRDRVRVYRSNPDKAPLSFSGGVSGVAVNRITV